MVHKIIAEFCNFLQKQLLFRWLESKQKRRAITGRQQRTLLPQTTTRVMTPRPLVVFALRRNIISTYTRCYAKFTHHSSCNHRRCRPRRSVCLACVLWQTSKSERNLRIFGGSSCCTFLLPTYLQKSCLVRWSRTCFWQHVA